MSDFALVQKVTKIICIAQLLASFAMALIASFDLRSILYSGPVLSLLGLLFASATLTRRSWPHLIFGLSAPLICTFCALLIATFKWGPQWQSGWPIVIILVAYVVVIAPLAVVVVLDLWRTSPPDEIPSAWRFSMKTLFVVTTAACVLSVALRFVVEIKADTAIFTSFAAINATLSAIVAWRFMVKRKEPAPGDEAM